MKNTLKNLGALLMAVVMVFSTSVAAFAAEVPDNTADVTISSDANVGSDSVKGTNAYVFYNSGSALVSASGTFYISSSRTYAIAATINGGGTAYFFVHKISGPNGAKEYPVSTNINANGTGYSWNVPLVAGCTYEIGFIAGTGTYSYTMAVW